MEAKKKYTPSGVVIAEMICSAILVIAVFLPWVRVESMGEIKEIALTEYGPLAFIYGGVFVFNIILKFFKRSRWLSALTALVAILMHTELGADHLNSTPNYYPVHYAPAIGEQIIFVVGLALMIIVCVSWIVSLLNSIANYYRNKQYLMLYSSCLGLFFLLFVVAMLIGIVMAGSADAFTEGEDTPFKMVVGGFFVVGIIVFFLWAVIGILVWLFRCIRRRGKGVPVIDASENISQASSHDSSGSGQNEKPNNGKKLFILGICAVFVLFVGARMLNTCKGIQQESGESSSVQVEETDALKQIMRLKYRTNL